MKTENQLGKPYVSCNLISIKGVVKRTYNQITDDDGGQKERYARNVAHKHTVPHRLDPFSAEYTKDDHERMHKVGEIPSW